MAARIYTVRFSSGDAPADAESYTVPAGKRAVIRSLTVVIKDTSTGQLILEVAGVTIVHLFTPPQRTNHVFDLRAVAYAGEVIWVTTGGGALSWSLSGFLFDDGGT